jgi:hypothetical protein
MVTSQEALEIARIYAEQNGRGGMSDTLKSAKRLLMASLYGWCLPLMWPTQRTCHG